MKQKTILDTKDHKLVLTEYGDGLQLYVENGEESKAGLKLDVPLAHNLMVGVREWLDEQPIKNAIEYMGHQVGNLYKKLSNKDSDELMKKKAEVFISKCNVHNLVSAKEGGVIYISDLMVDFIKELKEE